MASNVRPIFDAHQKTQRTCFKEGSGEITEFEQSTTHYTSTPKEPPYIKVYTDDLSAVTGLPHGQRGILYELAKLINYRGMIVISTLERRRIAEDLGISDKTFRNGLREILKRGLLTRHSPSDYEANPHYFARGKWDEIRKQRKKYRMTLDYDFDTGERRITTEEGPDE